VKLYLKSICAVFCLMTACAAQSPILQNMLAKSSDVVAVTCEAVRGGMTDEEGVEEWTALCRVDAIIKGEIIGGRMDKKILVLFNRFTFGASPEPLRFSTGNRYIVFLDGIAGAGTIAPEMDPIPMYRLFDRWLSVQPYEWHLVRELNPDVKIEKEAKSSSGQRI
jgi:hypothetical protein